MHRGLGVHVSKVRSLTLDRWDEDAVKVFLLIHAFVRSFVRSFVR